MAFAQHSLMAQSVWLGDSLEQYARVKSITEKWQKVASMLMYKGESRYFNFFFPCSFLELHDYVPLHVDGQDQVM